MVEGGMRALVLKFMSGVKLGMTGRRLHLKATGRLYDWRVYSASVHDFKIAQINHAW